MELLYVWIEDYKNIKKQGFNFSPEHWFDFEYEEDKDGKVTGGTLKHEKRNPNYPENFFGENISNVTAIVGKNGSGKTNILEFAMENIFNQRKSEKANFIISFLDENNEMCYFNDCDFKIKLDFGTEHKNPIKDENIYWRYYSANLQRRSTKYSISKIESPPVEYTNRTFNISTYGQLEGVEINTGNKKTIQFKDFFTAYQFKNTHRQIIFLREQGDNLALIKQHVHIPNNLELQIPTFSEEEEHILKTYFRATNHEREISERLKLKILIKTKVHPPFSYQTKELKQVVDNGSNIIKKILQKFEKQVSETKKGKSILEKAKNAISNCDELITYLFSTNDINNLNWNRTLRSLSNTINYSIKINNFNAIKFHEKITQTIGSDFEDLIELKWEGLSAGEEVLLNQMSTFYEAFKEINDNSYIMLAIDEGEVTLHPEWQREYCNLIQKTIELISKPNQKTQLILSTHSPFLVSDLPKENIIFLDKENETGNCKVCQPENMSNTFGANIHSLYRNSFFLENGLMGEFAKGKIDGVIKDLNQSGKDIPEKRQKAMQFIIQQIGEPIIKRKLQQMYDETFHSPEQIDNRIKALEEEIEKLKGRKS